MLSSKKHNSKGFTLVELLAVIAILGIIMIVAIPGVTMLINRSKSDSRDSMEKTLEMAARSYANGNSQALPKTIGESTLIKAKDLKKSNYLKEELVDYDKNSCMDDSVVRIYKYANNGYTYTPYLYCDGDEVPEVITPEDPIVSVVFTDEQGNNIGESSENVNIAMADIDIKGNSDGDLAVDGYSYAISACYKSQDICVSEDAFTEIYNSGSISANGNKTVSVHKKLRDYVDITTVSTFRITVNAYNVAGGVITTSVSSSYLDTTPPSCVYDESQPAEDYWNNQDKKRTITVKCVDGDGSGCVRDKYVKTFTTEMDSSIITIEDNAGNKTDCPVRVHLDWTAPTVTINAYKMTSDGGKGDLEATIVANNAAPTQTLTQYASGYGADSWLNLANFPYGVFYEVSVTDNVTVSSGKWSENAPDQKKDNSTEFDFPVKIDDHKYAISGDFRDFSITESGWRKGNYTVTDLSGNKVRINILAALDLNPPICESSGGFEDWRNENLTLYGKCSDGNGSGCVEEMIHLTFDTDINTTTASPGRVLDYANNETMCPENQIVKIDKTPPKNVKINMYKATSASAPTSTSGLTNYSSGSWTNTNVYAVASGATDSGSGLKGYYLTTKGKVTQSEVRETSHYFTKEGTTTTYWKVCDNVGNCFVDTPKEVKIDKTAPSISSVGYKYRSSLYGSNGKCQMVPNSSCDLIDCRGYLSECSNENNRRLVIRSNINSCKNSVLNGTFHNGCNDSTVAWKHSTISNSGNQYNTDYIGSIFSVNGGQGVVYFKPETIKASDATSDIKIKKIYVRDGINTGFAMNNSSLAYSSDGSSASLGLTRTLTSSTRGSVYKIYVEDNAGNSKTWTVAAQFTGMSVYNGFWKYTPYEYNVLSHRINDTEAQGGNTNWAYWAHGWVKRFYIRTFMGEEDFGSYNSWSYYSNNKYHLLKGEGTCGSDEGCQLHGWYKIDNVLYFFNTDEISVDKVPNGWIATNRWVTACGNSSYYLTPPEGGCNTNYITRWCNGSGACS